MLDSALTHFQSLGESAEGKDLMNLALLRGRVKKRQAEKNPSGSLRSFWQRIKDFFLRLRTPGKKEIQEATSSHIEDALTRKARTNLLERVCETVVDDIAENTGKTDAKERIDTALLLLAQHIADAGTDQEKAKSQILGSLTVKLSAKSTNAEEKHGEWKNALVQQIKTLEQKEDDPELEKALSALKDIQVVSHDPSASLTKQGTLSSRSLATMLKEGLAVDIPEPARNEEMMLWQGKTESILEWLSRASAHELQGLADQVASWDEATCEKLKSAIDELEKNRRLDEDAPRSALLRLLRSATQIVLDEDKAQYHKKSVKLLSLVHGYAKIPQDQRQASEYAATLEGLRTQCRSQICEESTSAQHFQLGLDLLLSMELGIGFQRGYKPMEKASKGLSQVLEVNATLKSRWQEQTQSLIEQLEQRWKDDQLLVDDPYQNGLEATFIPQWIDPQLSSKAINPGIGLLSSLALKATQEANDDHLDKSQEAWSYLYDLKYRTGLQEWTSQWRPDKNLNVTEYLKTIVTNAPVPTDQANPLNSLDSTENVWSYLQALVGQAALPVSLEGAVLKSASIRTLPAAIPLTKALMEVMRVFKDKNIDESVLKGVVEKLFEAQDPFAIINVRFCLQLCLLADPTLRDQADSWNTQLNIAAAAQFENDWGKFKYSQEISLYNSLQKTIQTDPDSVNLVPIQVEENREIQAPQNSRKDITRAGFLGDLVLEYGDEHNQQAWTIERAAENPKEEAELQNQYLRAVYKNLKEKLGVGDEIATAIIQTVNQTAETAAISLRYAVPLSMGNFEVAATPDGAYLALTPGADGLNDPLATEIPDQKTLRVFKKGNEVHLEIRNPFMLITPDGMARSAVRETVETFTIEHNTVVAKGKTTLSIQDKTIEEQAAWLIKARDGVDPLGANPERTQTIDNFFRTKFSDHMATVAAKNPATVGELTHLAQLFWEADPDVSPSDKRRAHDDPKRITGVVDKIYQSELSEDVKKAFYKDLANVHFDKFSTAIDGNEVVSSEELSQLIEAFLAACQVQEPKGTYAELNAHLKDKQRLFTKKLRKSLKSPDEISLVKKALNQGGLEGAIQKAFFEELSKRHQKRALKALDKLDLNSNEVIKNFVEKMNLFAEACQIPEPQDPLHSPAATLLQQRSEVAKKLLPTLKNLSTAADHEALFFHVFELYFALGIDNPPAELPKDRDALMNKLDEFLQSADGQSTKTRLDAIAKRFKDGECGADVKQNKDAFENRIERFAHSLQVDGAWQTGPLKLGRGFGLFGWHAAKTTPNSAARWTGFAAQQVSKQMLSDSNYSAEGWDEMASVLSVKAQIVSVMQNTDEPEKKDDELLKDLFGTPIGIFTHSAMELNLLRFGQPCDDAGRTLRGYQKLLATQRSAEDKQQLLTAMFAHSQNDLELWKRICGFRNTMHLIQKALKDIHPDLLPEAQGWLTALQAVASQRLGDQKTVEIDEDLYTMTQRLRGEERIGQQRIKVKKDPLIELNMFPEVQRDAMRQTLNVMKIEDSKNRPIDNPIPKEWPNDIDFGLPAIQEFWRILEKHKISPQVSEQLLWLTNQVAEGNSYELLNLWVAAEAGYSQFHLDESQATALAKWIITPVSPQSTGETKALKLNIDQEGQSLTYTCTQFYEARRQDDPYRPPLRLQSTSTTRIENNGTTSGKMTLQRL
jgi:hypothetical protein